MARTPWEGQQVDVITADAGLLQSRYRLTRQRSAVLRALSGGGHLTAETILELVRPDLPSISLGTVYRTLDILREIGLVQVFSFAGGAARFEAAVEKHHHLLCSRCRSLEDVAADGLADIVAAVARRTGFTPDAFTLTVLGRCKSCTD